MPSQMHRKGEGTITLGTKQGSVSVTAPLARLALRLGEPQHAPDRFYRSVGMRFRAMRAKRACSLSCRANFAESLMPIL